MAIATQPNRPLTISWTEIASGVSQVVIQVLDGGPVLVAIGSDLPAAASTDGFRVRTEMTFSGLTTEKVFVRAEHDVGRFGGVPVLIAIAKG